MTDRTPLLLAGARTPFVRSAGPLRRLTQAQLAAALLRGLVDRAGLDPTDVGAVALGTVAQDATTPNLARSAWLAAGLPPTVPGWTTSMAGLSPNVAVTSVADAIALGRLDLAVAGGVETFSDPPVRLGPGLRRAFMRLRQARGARQRLRALSDLRPADLTTRLLDVPAPADDHTGLTMVEATERMAAVHGVDRAAGDAFAVSSHRRAVAAAEHHARHRLPVPTPDGTVVDDDGPRPDTDADRVAALPPVAGGVVTAASASGLTDGGAAVVVGTAAAAERHGLAPVAALVDSVFVGTADPVDAHLLGPAVAIPRLLARHGLTLADVDVLEVHEAFAAQVLANVAVLDDDPAGPVDHRRLNAWGGSIALGNPFGATGARLLWTAADRLRVDGGELAVVASCAGGALGTATLLRRVAG